MTPSEVGPAVAALIPTPLQLFLGFAHIGAVSFGGALPWARYVLVEGRGWLSPEEFTDTLALCQLLPGPNVVNMSVAIGARFRGPIGSLAAALGLTVLPVAIALALVALYGRFAHVPAVNGALAAMAAAAAGLVVAVAIKMAEPVLRRRFWAVAPAMALTFGAVALLRWPLWPVILVMAPLAILAGWRAR